ncbi:MAG: hypothetical protein JW726_18195 [Anaerolineales bacterium]|nr:hypothetical protein [Anaerolineales bacterium]
MLTPHALLSSFPFRLLLVLTAFVLFLGTSSARAEQPIVHAVLFYSPVCGHCHKVITETLPPLTEKYGEQLQIFAIDATKQAGSDLYQSAIHALGIPAERLGVPTLVIGDYVLVGSGEIPQTLPGLVEFYLGQGGVDWPAIPGLEEAIAATLPSATEPPATPTAEPTSPAAPTGTVAPLTNTPPPLAVATEAASATDEKEVQAAPPLDMHANFMKDPLGSLLALVVLIGMVAVVGLGMLPALRPTLVRLTWQVWLPPLLALAGLGVAGYLFYVETAHVVAVSGPVGNCNTVQQSVYARLFGVSVGMLGVVGYAAILLTWLVGLLKGQIATLSALAMLVITFGGTLFSIYLTFLEPFVIGAICAWCLGSAVLMTLLFVLAIPYYWSRRYRNVDN